MLTRAFGVPAVFTEVLRDVSGIAAAYIYGSWAARHDGHTGRRPVGDIDVLVLGEPDRDQLYAALSAAGQRLARPVRATIRDRALAGIRIRSLSRYGHKPSPFQAVPAR